MKISQVSKATGLSSSTIRFYEELDIIRNIKRDSNNIRIYSESDIKWISFIKGFKSTLIPLDKIIRYADLYYQGDHSINKRIELLGNHLDVLQTKQLELQKAVDFITNKIKFYHDKANKVNNKLNCL